MVVAHGGHVEDVGEEGVEETIPDISFRQIFRILGEVVHRIGEGLVAAVTPDIAEEVACNSYLFRINRNETIKFREEQYER